jgi:hypothetical protein
MIVGSNPLRSVLFPLYDGCLARWQCNKLMLVGGDFIATPPPTHIMPSQLDSAMSSANRSLAFFNDARRPEFTFHSIESARPFMFRGSAVARLWYSLLHDYTRSSVATTQTLHMKGESHCVQPHDYTHSPTSCSSFKYAIDQHCSRNSDHHQQLR